MATSEVPPPLTKLSLASYQTALCVVPPSDLSQDIERLRSQYDQAYETWPAHINLVYPFVPTDLLPVATERIQAKLKAVSGESNVGDIPMRLDSAGYFPQRNGNTVHLKPAEDQGSQDLKDLRRSILAALGHTDTDERPYNPHLTVGQTRTDKASLDFLLNKVNLLSSISWKASKLLVLVRERSSDPSDRGSSKMRIWGTIDLSENASVDEDLPSLGAEEDGLSLQSLRESIEESHRPNPNLEVRTTYRFSRDDDLWVPISPSAEETSLKTHVGHKNLTISSYNVLADSSPSQSIDRYEKLVQNIIAGNSVADILVLQEVCDEFLTLLLANDAVRIRYLFASHGPPHQDGIPPLSSLRNIVVLSRSEFSWGWLPFETRHKGAAILKMHNLGSWSSTQFLPLIVAGVHLTSGLTDGAVKLKSAQLHSLLDLLEKDYPKNPRILAGDFNITTSSQSIGNALGQKTITPDTVKAIQRMEALIHDSLYSDAWVVSRREFGDISLQDHGHIFAGTYNEGEYGATFDPKWNSLAAESVTSDTNAQRYDRILVHDGNCLLKAVGLNFFGIPTPNFGGDDEEPTQLGSDHWGIRASVRLDQRFGQVQEEPRLIGDTAESASEKIRHAPAALRNADDFKLCLSDIIPDEQAVEKRKSIFDNVKNVITGEEAARELDEGEETSEPRVPMVFVPVGSYGLGTWNTSSDIDCLCVSSISTKTFFALAVQRIRKATDIGIQILRKVRAATGTMLELELDGVKLDLHYCPAADIVERFDGMMALPPNDPLLDLSPHALSKLQPFRDQEFIKELVPDLDILRLAIRFITAWAKRCGIYGSKFGYLGGIHITMMVSCLHKLLYDGVGRVSPPELVYAFFHHYSSFDWGNTLELRPGTHNRYHRLPSESMVILAHHSPTTNIARAIAAPSARAIIAELKRVDTMLSEPGMTWAKIIAGGAASVDRDTEIASPGAKNFLTEHPSYAKVNIQYWGRSPSKVASLLGWLESRFFRLLIDFDRRLPSIHPRIWPTRFTSKDTADNVTDDDETEFQCCYLIGLTRRSDIDLDKEERKKAQQTLQLILDSFTAHIQDSPAYYDSTTTWIETTHVKQSELGELKLDNRSLAKPIAEGLDSDDEDEDDYDEELDEEIDEFLAAQRLASRNRSKTPGISAPKSRRKLRPAVDVLTRLRWDPNIDPSDYVVGYEDRFLGAIEMPISRWKSEQTDEEFIPQHRILYFRRKSDGVKVWDRETRTDELFGSGAGKGKGGRA